MDISNMNATEAQFTNLTVSAAGTGGFEQSGTDQVLTNSSVTSPYLFANSITLPDLSISIKVG